LHSPNGKKSGDDDPPCLNRPLVMQIVGCKKK